jgi:YebC/PmpR family DNA-binding regulatory protein
MWLRQLTRPSCVVGCLSTTAPARGLAVVGRKSKNVAKKKNKLDAERTKRFTRIGVKLLLAARKGGTDPEKNVELARALQEAQSIRLPKENIERALRKATEAGSADDYKPNDYEVFGFGGVGLVVRTLTDNTNRAVSEIKATARKQEVKMASSGSVLFNFALKGVIKLSLSGAAGPNSALVVGRCNEERMLEIALDAGVDDIDIFPPAAHDTDDDDVEEDSTGLPGLPVVVTSPEALGPFQDALVRALAADPDPSLAAAVEVRCTAVTALVIQRFDPWLCHDGLPLCSPAQVTGELGYVPVETVAVGAEDRDRNVALVEAFEALEDVDAVYHNMARTL